MLCSDGCLKWLYDIAVSYKKNNTNHKREKTRRGHELIFEWNPLMFSKSGGRLGRASNMQESTKMKFGAHLAFNVFLPWRSEYIQYDMLKQQLKARQLDHNWNNQDEIWFSQTVTAELNKVDAFLSRKRHELQARINYCEQVLQTIARSSSASSSSSQQGVTAATVHNTIYNSNNNQQCISSLQQALIEILYDTNDLSKFIRLNYTGFQKILKKHDKWTKLNLRTQMIPLFQQRGLDNQRFDDLLVRISQLRDLCRLCSNISISTQEDDEQEERRSIIKDDNTSDAGDFERATEKYWVHPENVTEVKALLLFHLPVLRYNSDQPYQESETAISSVYMDNQEFDLYTERLQRDEGAEAIRLRWYGAETSQDIYVERKTHHAPWLDGQKSIKERFRLDEKNVDPYLTGQYTPQMVADHLLNQKRKKSPVAEKARTTSASVYNSIHQRKLKPILRCFYNRLAFQKPGDPRVRVSLDTDLAYIREDKNHAYHGKRKWRRDDVGIAYPFKHLPDQNDVHCFPYAVLETKIQTHLGQQMPEWLARLTNSHLVHPVPRFSKYLHGACFFFKERLPILPWWLSEVDINIKKPRIDQFGLSRTVSLRPLLDGGLVAIEIPPDSSAETEKRDSGMASSLYKPLPPPATSTTAGSQTLHSSTDGTKQTTTTGNNKKSFKGWFQQRRFYYRRLGNHYRKKIKRNNSINNGNPTSSSNEKGNNYNNSSGKVLPSVKVRVEPKTFFANERTFISWLQFCALILTISLSLINFGDHVSQLCGGFFLIIAALLSIYALWRYQYRAYQIRNRSNTRYDDMYGPAILCILLVIAIIVNFSLRFNQPATPNGSATSPYHPPAVPSDNTNSP
ncbi:VTC domain-containing protein [Phascolomyces articulosus]|uniref:VTC domain-containing protein n=1 Tax=Phascolomyces articulosus TaxID=60185 RepID=A0AAD5KFC8_9FUNG|nr:VTC domain-containing protein [Phascolomyces articulosus]